MQLNILYYLKSAAMGKRTANAGMYPLMIKMGLLTGIAIAGFEAINVLVIYRMVKLDYYLSLVAVVFLVAGFFISRNSAAGKKEQAAVSAGEQLISTEVAAGQPISVLTNREMEILQMISSGKSNKEMAALLYVELSTIKTHINNIYSKLAVRNRGEAKWKYEQLTVVSGKIHPLSTPRLPLL